jgi:CRISPR/Cas system-associated endonuclease Cas1
MWQGRVEKASARRTKRAKAQPALILCGHGVSLRVENGALTIQNGFTHYPQQRKIIRYFPGDVALPERIILLDGSGSISFDVLSWLAEQKVSLIRIDWKGDIVCVAGATGYSANPFRARWQLEARENPDERNDFCRSIIMRKIEATIITLEKSIPRSDKWERAVSSAYAGLSRLEENPPESFSGTFDESVKSWSQSLSVEGNFKTRTFSAGQGFYHVQGTVLLDRNRVIMVHQIGKAIEKFELDVAKRNGVYLCTVRDDFMKQRGASVEIEYNGVVEHHDGPEPIVSSTCKID